MDQGDKRDIRTEIFLWGYLAKDSETFVKFLDPVLVADALKLQGHIHVSLDKNALLLASNLESGEGAVINVYGYPESEVHIPGSPLFKECKAINGLFQDPAIVQIAVNLKADVISKILLLDPSHLPNINVMGLISSLDGKVYAFDSDGQLTVMSANVKDIYVQRDQITVLDGAGGVVSCPIDTFFKSKDSLSHGKQWVKDALKLVGGWDHFIMSTLTYDRILLFGDSLTQQGFDPDLRGWGAFLANQYMRKVEVCNRGFSGGYSRKLQAELDCNDQTAKSFAPDVRVLVLTPPPVDEEKWGEHCKQSDRKPDRTLERTGLYRDACVEVAKEARSKWPDDIRYVDTFKAGHCRGSRVFCLIHLDGDPQESPRLDDRPQGIRVVSNFRQRTGTGSMSPTSLKPGPFSREAPLASIRRRTDSSQRSFCPSRTKILIFAVVLGAFALGLYVSGLIHLIIDVGQIAKTGSNHSVHAPQASQDEIARAVKLVEDDWRHKYKCKDELHANHEVKKNPQDARDIEKVNAVTSREDDGNQNQHQESSKKKQSEQMLKQSELSGTSGKKEQDDEPDEERKTPIQVFPTLPSSSIWCEGNSIQTRNLCYNPEKQRWFVLKTSSSTFENVPVNHQRTGLLEAGTVAGHPWVRFHLDEVSPFNSVVQNLNHFVGKGDYDFRMPFSLNTHRLLFIDPYESSESTRPFQYLTNHPLRMIEYLESDKSVTTCFRDAIVGSSKLTTWYQYGFEEPQGRSKTKSQTGFTFERSRSGEDELPEQYIGRSPEWEAEFDKKHPETDERSIDFVETDLIIIMARRRNRLMLNEEDLRMHLEKTFKLQAIFVRNEDHTFEEQIKLMRRARVVLAMHGSILIMGMFCRRGTVMIEMFPYAVPSDNYTPYKTMCQLPGMALIYRAWENKHPNTSITHDDEDAMLGGINHLPADEQEISEVPIPSRPTYAVQALTGFIGYTKTPSFT
ncbi:hypothetical protein BC829DRAFT_412779 [Chytridium lagenaria]|nr:hypothetical protein BC829DRAFT_412779 [Chytridium lagenaria]